MTRAACGEGAIFTRLAQRSHELWREIEHELEPYVPDALLTLNGQLLIDSPGASEGHGVENFLEETVALSLKHHVPHELMNSSEIRSRFPAFAVGDAERAYFDRSSGFLRPEACISSQLSLAKRFNAVAHANERVVKFESNTAGVRVVTTRAEYVAQCLIVTAGPWLPDMLPGSLSALFMVTRQVLYWFALKNEADLPLFRPERFPAFVWFKHKPKLLVYGFPALADARNGIKLATEERNETTPGDVNPSVSDSEKEAFYEAYVRTSFPMLSNDCVRTEVCLYTIEKERERFIIDRHPSMDNVICVSACSGHGFKHSIAIGEMLADMALDPTHKGPPQFSWNYAGPL